MGGSSRTTGTGSPSLADHSARKRRNVGGEDGATGEDGGTGRSGASSGNDFWRTYDNTLWVWGERIVFSQCHYSALIRGLGLF